MKKLFFIASFCVASLSSSFAQDGVIYLPDNSIESENAANITPETILAGFNEDSTIEPLELPAGILDLYDAKHPLSHLDEHWTEVFYQLLESARTLSLENRFIDASFVLQQALRLSPDHANTHNMLGTAYIQMRMFDKAAEAFLSILETNPNNWHATFNLGEAYFVSALIPNLRINPNGETPTTHDVEKLESALFYFSRVQAMEKMQDYEPLIDFKIFLCHLLLGNQEEYEAIFNTYDAYSGTPAWYVMNAAITFEIEDDTEATTNWIGSAQRIFPAQELNMFLDSFLEMGWAETTENSPGTE